MGSSRVRLGWAALLGMSTLAVACGSITSTTPSQSETLTNQGGGGSSSGSGGSGGAGEGLPCDIAATLADKCTSCHSSPPVASTPMSLLTYADLAAPSKSDPSKSVAEVSLARMKSATDPMPPAPGTPASAAEIASFEAWVNAGAPTGTCGSVDAGPNPFDAPAQCTSGESWNKGDDGSKLMNPGKACVSCHAQELDAPKLSIGGTVYATAHEPDKCNAAVVEGPAISTAVIEVTDKNGKVISIPVNSVGNFYRKTSQGAVAMPFVVKVKYDGRERIMATEQTSGDCNACHTQNGTKDAPGRVLLP